MKRNDIYNILGKYLANEISDEEKIIVQNWLNESERNTQEFEFHKKAWEETHISFRSSDSELVFKNAQVNTLRYVKGMIIGQIH